MGALRALSRRRYSRCRGKYPVDVGQVTFAMGWVDRNGSLPHNTEYGYMVWGERPRARITPPCLPGRFCDCLERLLIKEVEQSYIYKRDQSNMVPKAGFDR